MDVEDYYWIGIVRPEDAKQTVAFITPLAYFHEKWQVVKQTTCRELFPNNGKVTLFAKDFPGSLTEQIWKFRPRKNDHAEDIPKNAHYLVNDEIKSARLAQIIDWTARANLTYELVDLLAEGIAAENCFCQRVYISFQSCLYGPIRLEPDSHCFKPREYLQSSNSGGQPLFISRYTLPEDGFLDLTQTYAQLTFLDESMLDTPIGKEDWSLPQVTIKRVLQASNDLLAETEGNVHLVDRRLRELARLNSREGPPALRLDPVTLKRAQYIVSNQLGLLQEMSIFIEQLSADHPLMKAARAWELQTRRQEIEREAEALAWDKQEQLLHVQCNLEEAETKLEQLRNSAEEAGQRYEQSVEAFNTFEGNVQERLAALKEEPLRVLAELRITASLFPLLMGETGQLSNGFKGKQTVPPVPQLSEQQVTLSNGGLNWRAKDDTFPDLTPLQKRQGEPWNQAAKQARVKPKDVRISAAALIAGLIPALKGEETISTLKAVAQTIAYGRILVIPVPLTALSPLDLFGTIDMQRQMFIPAPGGLADAILQAQQHPDELLLIVLEGIDRVAGLPVYVPLLRQYMEVRQAESKAAPINLFHSRALDPVDPYLKLAWFTWPHNVLLAVTLDGDMSSLPLPAICDRWLVPFEPVRSQKGTGPSHTSASPCSDISFQRWQAWEQEVRFQAIQRGEPPDLLDHQQRAFRAALAALRISDADAVIQDIWPEQFGQEDEEVD